MSVVKTSGNSSSFSVVIRSPDTPTHCRSEVASCTKSSSLPRVWRPIMTVLHWSLFSSIREIRVLVASSYRENPSVIHRYLDSRAAFSYTIYTLWAKAHPHNAMHHPILYMHNINAHTVKPKTFKRCMRIFCNFAKFLLVSRHALHLLFMNLK